MTMTTPNTPEALIDPNAIPKAPETIVLRDATMGKTEGIPTDLDLSKPHNIAKVAMMDNVTHPDLIGAMYNEMVAGGIPKHRCDFFLNHFLIRTTRGKSYLAQQTGICSFLNWALLRCGESTYAARNYVFMMGKAPAPADFFTLFRHVPLDALLKNELPKTTAEDDEAYLAAQAAQEAAEKAQAQPAESTDLVQQV